MSENKEFDFEYVQALVKKTDKENPKPEDMAEMKRYLDQNSSLVRMNEYSDLAFDRFTKMTSNSALQQELAKRQIKEKRQAFGYDSAPLIEKMLIDQVILCNLRLNYLDLLYTSKTGETHTLPLGIYWEKRISSAQKRFLRACETLSKVKKHLADAELKEQQARNKRGKSALMANKLLNDLSK